MLTLQVAPESTKTLESRAKPNIVNPDKSLTIDIKSTLELPHWAIFTSPFCFAKLLNL